MTQNKKKGIAKKALSISLVAAMLATSNVPVWASGFEAVDPAAEGFAVEEAAEVTADDSMLSASSVVGEGDIKFEDLKADQKSAIWDEDAYIQISGKIINGTTGNELTKWDYRWVDEDGIAVASGEGINNVADMKLERKADRAGKTLTLWVSRDDESAEFDINTGITVAIQKRALGEITTSETSVEYNGKSQNLDATKVTVEDEMGTVVGNPEGVNYTLSTNSGSQAGDILTVTATANSDSPYTGTVALKNGVEIQRRTYQPGDIIASVTEDGLTYQYTGSEIVVDNSKVALNESKSEEDGDNKLSGADLSDAIKKAETTETAVGTSTVTVTVDNTKLKNIKVGDGTGTGTLDTKEVVTIEKRDLANNTDISLKYGAVLPNSPKANIIKDLQFKDGNTEITLVNDVDYIADIKNEKGESVETVGATGNYTLTITAKENGNAVGSKTIALPVVSSIITDASFTKGDKYAPDFTGTAIEPTATELGNLKINVNKGQPVELGADAWKIVGYENNINASKTDSNDDFAYVVVEITDKNYAGETVKVPFFINKLSVASADVKVPKEISYNKDYKKAEEYGITPSITAKNKDGKIAIALAAADYEVVYAKNFTNAINNDIEYTVNILNDNFKGGDTSFAKETKIVAKALEDSMIQVNPSSYVYTGGAIIPEYNVIDGGLVLYKDQEYTESITNNVNVGKATITITGTNKDNDPEIFPYSGKASATFDITPADINSVKVEVADQDYTGRQVCPRTFKATLNGNNVTSQFEITGYGENVKAGTGTLTLAPVKGNKNFTGSDLTVEFNIVAEKVTGTLTVYDEKGIAIQNPSFDYDGTAKTFAKEVLSNLKLVENGKKPTATVEDFEIKYVDNVTGAYNKDGNNVAYVYAVAKEGTGYAGNDTITTADGTEIKGVVAKVKFIIKAAAFAESNVTIKNAVYAGGLPVKPQVTVQYGGKTLVEGQDYELVDCTVATDVTNNKKYDVKIKGIGGYSKTGVLPETGTFKWGIDKKDLSDCDVTMTNGVVTVKNGTLPVPADEYTVKTNDNGTVTVTAAKDSKNYVGSVTVSDSVPETPDATVLSVTDRTTSTVSLKWDEVEGAEGYTIWFRSEYDTEMSRKIINGGDVTSWKQTGLQPGTKYFYAMRSWVKDANGKYVFSEVSPTQRGTTKPAAAVVTGVSADNGYVKVRLAGEAAGAEKYSMCYSKTMNGFDNDNFKVGIRTSYTVRTFKDALDAGTYYVRVKSYRDLGNNKRVYGAWSNAMKVVVK